MKATFPTLAALLGVAATTATSNASLSYTGLGSAASGLTSLDFGASSATRVDGPFTNPGLHDISLTTTGPVSIDGMNSPVFTNDLATQRISFTFNFPFGLTSGHDDSDPFVDFTPLTGAGEGTTGFTNQSVPRLAIAGRTSAPLLSQIEFSASVFNGIGSSSPLNVTPGPSNSSANVREFNANTTRPKFSDYVEGVADVYDFSNPNLAVFTSDAGTMGGGVSFIRDNVGFISNQSEIDRYTYALANTTITFDAGVGNVFPQGTEFRFSLDGVAAAPEPSASVLGLLGMLGLLARRKR